MTTGNYLFFSVHASDLILTNNNSAFSSDSQSVSILSQDPNNQQRGAVDPDNGYKRKFRRVCFSLT